MKFLGKPYTLIKFLRKTYLVNENKKKKVLRKEFDAFQRLQGKSFKQMTTCISLIILMCENSGVEIIKLWHDGLVGKTAIASIQGCRFKSQRRKY